MHSRKKIETLNLLRLLFNKCQNKDGKNFHL